MMVWGLLLGTLIVAGLSLWLVYSARTVSNLVLGVAIGAFVYLYGMWVYASIYLGRAFVVAVAVALVLRLRRNVFARASTGRFRTAANWVGVAVFAALAVLYFTGTEGGRPRKISLRFPLRGGPHIVLQGGRGYPPNLFHGLYRGAVYAVDIAELTSWGGRARGIASTRLEDYAVFGDTVYAPCSGVVETARDDNPDNTPPDRTRGPSNLNAVVIAADSATVFLGHLRHHGVFVQEGDSVTVGDPLGLVGNSGFSLEPHLHIQAHLRDGSGRPWYTQPPLLILFGGKEYRLFDVIDRAAAQ